MMRPMLELLADRKERSRKEVKAELADRLDLSPEDLAATIPSGNMTYFANRAGWAMTHLTRAELLERPKKATYHITDRGLKVLAENPDRVDMKVLKQFPEYVFIP